MESTFKRFETVKISKNQARKVTGGIWWWFKKKKNEPGPQEAPDSDSVPAEENISD